MVTETELADRIVSARRRSGRTQDQVASALGIPRTAVTQLESGNRRVSSLELVRLANLFEVDVRDLLEGRDPNTELVSLFRSKTSNTDSTAEAAVREMLPVCRAVSDLEDLLEANDPSSVTGRVYSYPVRALNGSPQEQGRSLAQLERQRLGLGLSPIQDLPLLALKSGLVVGEHSLPEGISGIFLNARGTRSFIVLKEDENHFRKRFSLAHEYCHALVDGHERVIVSRYGAAAERERRADAFASAFLLPRDGILLFLSEMGVTPDQLDFTHVARLVVRYEISYEAAIVALDQSGLISPAKKSELQSAHRNAGGYIRRNLRWSDPQYSRTTLREWAFQRTLRALELGLISVRKGIGLAKLLGFDGDVVRQNLAVSLPSAIE